MLYAAQYRDMHTAVHNLLIYHRRALARRAIRIMNQDETLEFVPQYGDSAEINFRSPPTSFKGQRLTIVNNDNGLPTGVPDVF